MNTEKMMVVHLLIAILWSVVTLAITIGANVTVVTESAGGSVDMGTASVILDIAKNPAKGVLS